MPSAEKIKDILTKLAQKEVVNDSEVSILKEAIDSNTKQSFQFGEYVVNIGQGEGIKIGNQYVYQGNGSETILEALKTAPQDFFASQDPSNLSPAELKEAVIEFLGDIEEKVRYLKLFHAQKKIALSKQYIPIQVTLERIYQEKVNESLRSYGESEEDLKRIYAVKGEKYERKQEDWQKEQENHQRIVVLADPGMGKSTLLRMEASKLAQEEKRKLSDNSSENLTEEEIRKIIESIRLPLYLRLSDLAEGLENIENIEDIILKLIKRDYPGSGEKIEFLVREKLEKGRCLLLLDALDEVSAEKRLKLQPQLNPFIKKFPNKTICTSRIVSYTSFLDDAKEMEIVPFTEKQTAEYIEIWFKNIKADSALENKQVSAKGLIDEIESKPQIQGLTQNPLLLSLVCSLYQTKGIELPARKTQVYEKAVKYMLSDWSADNQRLSFKQGWVESKTELLEFLAYQFSCKNTEVLTTRKLKKQIDRFKKETINSDFKDKTASDLLDELSQQDGIIQKLSEKGDRYLFLHRTFQEYLTASYLNEEIEEDRAVGISLVKEHLWQFDWHETISLVAGLMDDPIPLLQVITQEEDDLFKTLLLLSGLCISECPKIEHDLITEIVDKIGQFWQSYPGASFIETNLVSLANIGNDKAVSVLITALGDADSDVKRDAASALGKIGNDKAVSALITALGDADSDVKRDAASALGKIGNDKAVSALITALGDADSDVKRDAASALGKIGNDKAVSALANIGNDKAVEPLIAALDRSDSGVRYYAASALRNIGNDKAVEPLITALDRSDSHVKCNAAYALGEIGNDKAVEPLITALGDADSHVKRNAALALRKIGNDKAVEPLITALGDVDSHVKRNAASALEKINSAEIILKLLNKSDLDIYDRDIFLLARKLMIRHSQELNHPLTRKFSK